MRKIYRIARTELQTLILFPYSLVNSYRVHLPDLYGFQCRKWKDM